MKIVPAQFSGLASINEATAKSTHPAGRKKIAKISRQCGQAGNGV
jgi:hypothetical protein